MKKEEFTNGIENFIIEEVAKHCHDTGQNVFDLVQNEKLRSTIDIILNDSKKLFYQINTTRTSHTQKKQQEYLNTKPKRHSDLTPIGACKREQIETFLKALKKYRKHVNNY